MKTHAEALLSCVPSSSHSQNRKLSQTLNSFCRPFYDLLCAWAWTDHFLVRKLGTIFGPQLRLLVPSPADFCQLRSSAFFKPFFTSPLLRMAYSTTCPLPRSKTLDLPMLCELCRSLNYTLLLSALKSPSSALPTIQCVLACSHLSCHFLP